MTEKRHENDETTDVISENATDHPEEEIRRNFLKKMSFVGGLIAAGTIPAIIAGCARRDQQLFKEGSKYSYADPENIFYSVCLQCHTACPIKCKLIRPTDDTAVIGKIDGNPYAAQTRIENLPYNSSPDAASKQEGKICPKGQAGIQTLYDPYRIRKVLKRVGKRGENKWRTIPFKQAVEEISTGKNLPSGCPSIGLQDTFAAKDRKTLDEMKKIADAYFDAYKKSGYTLSVDKFVSSTDMGMKALWNKHKDKFIDPEHPDLGPKNNGFVFMAGRIEHGRKELMKRFTMASFGSQNVFEHTTICEQSHHIGFQHMTNLYVKGKWTKGKHHLKPDLNDPEYVIFFGTGCFEANFGPPLLSGLYSNARQRGGFKSVVVDPRKSNTAKQADEWIGIKPGGDGAMAMGMLQVIINEKLYNETYLRNPNIATAVKFYGGNKSYSWAPMLVEVDNKGVGRRYVRWSDVVKDRGASPADGDEHKFVVVMPGGELLPITGDPGGKEVDPVLEVRPLLRHDKPISIGGKSAMTSFDLLAARVNEYPLRTYREYSGVSESTIKRLAREFAAAAPRCCAEFYRGPAQHTNGYYQATALVALNMLMGNCNVKGGWTAGGSHWHEAGGKDMNIFAYSKFSGALKAFGARCNKEKSAYNKFSLYKEKNGKWERPERPWYPLTGNLYQEIIPAVSHEWSDSGKMKIGYPYGITHLFLHKGTPVYSAPGGHVLIEMLQDSKKIPVFIASDIVIGETSMYADYIIPDVAVWERWGTPHTTPALMVKASKIRQPVVAPLTDTVRVDGVEMPLSMEAFLIAVGKRLSLPGFGNNAFNKPKAKKAPHPEVSDSSLAVIDLGLHHPEDWFFKAILNIVVGDYSKGKKGPGEGLCPAAEKEEIAMFLKARRHLPKSVFDPDRWKKKIGNALWPHFVYVLNRGGRFEDTAEWFNPKTMDMTDKNPKYFPGEYAHYEENKVDRKYKGNLMAHQYHQPFRLFCESVATTIDSMVPGKYFDGLPRLEPALDASDNKLDSQWGTEFNLAAITYKSILGGHSRTMPADPWLKELMPENKLLINPIDAVKLGVKKDDIVLCTSPSLKTGSFPLNDGHGRKVEMKIKANVTEDIAAGTVAISHHFGHWAYGSNDVEVDGQVVKGDPKRRSGITANPLFLLDPALKDVCMTDKIGGSASYYDTKIKVVKV